MSGLAGDGTAESVSRDQILRLEREQVKKDHEEDWQRLIHTLLKVLTSIDTTAISQPPVRSRRILRTFVTGLNYLKAINRTVEGGGGGRH